MNEQRPKPEPPKGREGTILKAISIHKWKLPGHLDVKLRGWDVLHKLNQQPQQ